MSGATPARRVRRKRSPLWLRGGGILACIAAAAVIFHGTRREPGQGSVLPSFREPQRRALTSPAVQPERLSGFQRAVVDDLTRQVKAGIRYQDGYFTGGDPPPDVGVCTDVVVRSFRAAGVDLRRAVAADVVSRRSRYDVGRPDPNIDHRRCRNLVVFFDGHARALPRGSAFEPGDVVFWDLGGGSGPDHVGMVANSRDSAGDLAVVDHMPGTNVSETAGLRRFPVTHHFRWNQ